MPSASSRGPFTQACLGARRASASHHGPPSKLPPGSLRRQSRRSNGGDSDDKLAKEPAEGPLLDAGRDVGVEIGPLRMPPGRIARDLLYQLIATGLGAQIRL